MRTARYVIRIKDDTPSWYKPDATTRNKQFSLFADTCRMLAKDGFEYSVTVSREQRKLDRDTGYMTFTITGTAGAAAKSKPIKHAHKWSLPAKLTIEQCQKRAAVAQNEINSAEQFHARTLKFDTPTWRKFDGVLHAAVIDGGFDSDVTLRENLAAAWCDVADPELGYHAGILRSILHQNLNYVLWELHYAANLPYRGMSGLCNPGDYFRYASPNIDSARKWYARDTSADAASKSAARDFMAQLGELRDAETAFWSELETMSGQREHFRPGVADTLNSNDEIEVAA